MRIQEVDIINFRALTAEKVIFNDYTCLVGPNGAGKSTVLAALKVFFRDSTDGADLTLSEQDFHLRNTNQPIVITVKFCDLEEAAQNDFAHYYRHGLLIVSAIATWDAATATAQVKQFGQRMGMEDFKSYFEAKANGAKTPELRKVYEDLCFRFSDLPAVSSGPAMEQALQSYESAHPELLTLLRSEDQFYGVSKGKNLLEKYVQWICVPAVKDATTEQLEARNNALKKLLERTVQTKISFKDPLDKLRLETEERYKAILAEHQGGLESLTRSLSAKLKDWAHPDATLRVQWHDDANAYVKVSEPLAQILAGEGNFEGDVSCFGHGLQRSFLLALLQELAGAGNTSGPRLVLACEEPELYQHPPQARHLASVLEALSKANSQVLVSTHSPFFISGAGFEDVRTFRPNPGLKENNVRFVTFKELAQTIADAMGEPPRNPSGLTLKVQQTLNSAINEMFFTSTLILVEGPEDQAYIKTYLTLMELWEKFRHLGCHIVQTTGKNGMIQPLAIATLLGIPTYVIFDADPADKGSGNKRDNACLLRLCGIKDPEPFPATIFRATNVHVWPTTIGPEVRSDFKEDQWSKAVTRIREDLKIDTPNMEKNAPFIGYVLSDMWQRNERAKKLMDLCEAIIKFASDVKATAANVSA